MVSRGSGGCGGYPYIWEQKGSLAECSSVCLEDAQCIKVQRDTRTGNCYASSTASSVQPVEPNGGSWECLFKELAGGVSCSINFLAHSTFACSLHPLLFSCFRVLSATLIL